MSTSVVLELAPQPARVPLLQRPLATYHLVLASTLLLLLIGLVMVFSASSVRAYEDFGSSYAIAARQGVYIAVGLPLMWAGSRLSVRLWRAAAYPLLLVTLGLLVLVLVVGEQVKGAYSWIPLPLGFNLQPSELAKLAVVLWCADLLARKQRLLSETRHLMIPLLPAALLVLGLVMLQPDLGTSVVIGGIVATLLWVVGTPLRWFAALGLGFLAAAAAFAVTSPFRMERLLSFRDPFADAQDSGFQAVQGLYALSSGGWFGLGLGASREKWDGGLPEAHTDYVFAIIGEELGLLGTLTVLALFAVLICSGVRIAARAADPFPRLAAAAATGWIAVQALINMGAVVGLLPITGLPLPLVSYGGSSLLSVLLAVGMLLAFARAEPDAQQALSARSGRPRLPARVRAGRQLRVVPPR